MLNRPAIQVASSRPSGLILHFPTFIQFAVQKKQDLTAVEGHIVLLEYLEEKPLLLSRPGKTSTALQDTLIKGLGFRVTLNPKYKINIKY